MIDSRNGIIGLAIGDAMGVPLEFQIREKLQQNLTKEMTGYGSHPVPKGTWSDDTSMTLCLIDSINQNGEINPDDIASKFVSWVEETKYTAGNRVFDIGRTCLRAIMDYKNGAKATEAGLDGEMDNGNGSLMRILPLVYYCYSKSMDDEEVYECVKDVSSITHKNEVSIMGCYIYVLFGIELLKGSNLKQAYNTIKEKYYSKFSYNCQNKYERIIDDNIDSYTMDDISSTGYVVDTLEATLWTLLTTYSYDEAIIKAINLGNDTDTVGACVGGVAGIYYGIDSINEEWKNDLIKYDYIEEMSNEFNNILNRN